MKKLLVLLFALSIGIVSCKGISGEAMARADTLEPLYSVSLSDESLTFSVKSNGCTKVEDFIVVLETVDQELGLKVIRTKADRCRRMPKVIELTLSIEAISTQSDMLIGLYNPLVVKTK